MSPDVLRAIAALLGLTYVLSLFLEEDERRANPETIVDQDVLYRRLAPMAVQGGKVTSYAYKLNGKPDRDISVELSRLTTPAEAVARGGQGCGLGAITAGLARRLGLTVLHTPSRHNPAHASIRGASAKTIRQLADETTIVIAPGQPKSSSGRNPTSSRPRLLTLSPGTDGSAAVLTHRPPFGSDLHLQDSVGVNPRGVYPRPRLVTNREQQLLHIWSAGATDDEAARAAGIAPSTVRDKKRALFFKLDATSKAELIRNAKRQGLLAA